MTPCCEVLPGVTVCFSEGTTKYRVYRDKAWRYWRVAKVFVDSNPYYGAHWEFARKRRRGSGWGWRLDPAKADTFRSAQAATAELRRIQEAAEGNGAARGRGNRI